MIFRKPDMVETTKHHERAIMGAHYAREQFTGRVLSL